MAWPFIVPGGRRGIRAETQAHLAAQIGAEPAYGFAEMVDSGGAEFSSERMSSFMERADRREWLLRLSNRKPMTWKTLPVPAGEGDKVAFALSIGFGNGSPLPQPSGSWELYVNDHLAVELRVVNHSQLWRRGPCAFAFAANRVESAEPFQGMTLSSLIRNEAFAAFGPALLLVPREWAPSGLGALIRVQSRAEADSSRWFQLDVAPSVLDNSDLQRAADLLAAGPPKAGGFNVYFGDIHTHSGQVMEECENKGCGRGTREENYRFAEGPGGLDFYALTDHEWQVDPHRAADYLALADAHNREGKFVCLPGFEHTSLLYGHRNVYFRDSGGVVINTNRDWGRPTKDPAKCLTPLELWNSLERAGVPFITAPHHPSSASHPATFDFFHPTHDRMVEVYSSWGSSEYYGDFPRGVSDRLRDNWVRDALRRGLRFGLIGSSDGHDGHPGDAQSPLVKHHHLFHFCGSGRAAVLAPALTRHDVFDALQARRCYATTGVPILLDFTLDGAVMGSELARPRQRRPQLRIRCRGASALDHIRIVKDSRVAATVPCHGEWAADVEWEDPDYAGAQPSCYYVRVVQRDRESAWSSPVWVG
jgi:hypothetical protein